MQGLKARLLAWKSTGFGLATGTLVIYLFQSFGCSLPTDWTVWALGILAALPGVLAKG